MASIFEGPTDIPLTDKTLYQRLVDRVSDKPDHLAVISDHENVSKTFKQLLEDVVKLVSGLRSQLNLSHDDNMALWSKNCYYYVIFQYAASALGLTLWLFDPNWTARELESALILSDATVLVLPGQGSPQNDKFEYIRVLDQVEPKNGKLTSIISIDGGKYDQSAHSSYLQYSVNQWQSGQHSVTHDDLDSKRPYLGLFTSGSTGQPKAVVHSQFAILNNRVMQASRFYNSEILRYCVPITLHHAFGSLAIVPQIAVSGLTLVLTGYKYSVSGFMKCMLKYECNSLAAVPTMTFDAINYLSQRPEIRLPHWSTLLSGGAALPEGTVQTLQKLVPSLTTVLMSYALSEMGPVTSWRNTDGADCSHLGTMVGHVSVKLENEMTRETLPIAVHKKVFIVIMMSIFEGATDIPLTDKTLYQRLVDRVSDKPDHLAVISDHEGVSITVKQLLEDVVKLVSGLMSQLGLSRDDNMAIWSRNCYYYVVFQYAVSALGLTLWLFDPNWTARELESALILSETTVLVLPGQGSPQNDKFEYIRVLEQVEQENVKLTSIITIDGRNYDQSAHPSYLQYSVNQCQSGQHSAINPELDSRRPYIGLFTSGSTGQPKAVVHSQFAILNNRVMQASRFHNSQVLRYCVPITLHHAFGSLSIVPHVAVSGLTIVLTGYRYSVSGFMKCMLKYECNSLVAVPTMTFDAINYLSQRPEIKLPHWSTLWSGGAALPEGTVQKLRKLVPSLTTVLMSYALSEMGPAVTSWRHTDGASFSHLGSVVGHVSVKLEDETTGVTVPIGQPGVIKVRSPFRMIGYHKDKPLTDQLFDQEGWFNTGDMGRFDQDGFLYFVGRAKEIISRGGEKFHPSETEKVLYMIQDVSECAVVPVPDDRLGQLALGFIKIAEGSQLTAHDVKAFMKQRLTPYKIPEHIVLTREALPKTGSGKISRVELQKLAFDYLDNITNSNTKSYADCRNIITSSKQKA
ncbi:Medium-chain acyl-CoA ligase ACSF2, mitochondrial [Halotydeus destructor]|nr:Medium-chain acyl-CoA ligase ACSF2, mitochondrial [Halotydeus destructor]